MSTRALQDGMMLLGFRDPITDEWLAGGTVEFYSAGTLNAKDAWEDKDKSVAIQSVSLDSSGQAQVYFDGVYKFIVKNSSGTTKYTLDNLKYQARNTSTVTKTANYQATVDDDYIICDTDGGAFTITLAAVAGVVAPITIKNIGSSSNDVTVDGSGSETIDGAASQALTDAQSQQYITDGAQWFGAGIATGTTFTSTSLVAGANITFTENAGVTTVATVGGELIDVQVFIVDDTWNKPSGCNAVEVICSGAGGGGGGSVSPTTGYNFSGPGGGGALVYGYIPSGLGATETITVGAGGIAGDTGGSDGGSGGDASFGTHAIAKGGGAGNGRVSATAGVEVPGFGGIRLSCTVPTVGYAVSGGGAVGATMGSTVDGLGSDAVYFGGVGSSPLSSGAHASLNQYVVAVTSLSNINASNPVALGDGGVGVVVGSAGAALEGGAGLGGIVIVKSYT